MISTLKNIDQNKIGCIGHSFGGVRCMYLSAMDKRIRAIILVNSVADLRKKGGDAKPIVHTWFGFLPGTGQYTDTDGILALIGTRPLMILSSENDPIFPLNEAEDQVKKASKLYENLGKKDDIKFIVIKNGEHTFPEEYRKQTYDFFDKYLKQR